LNYDFFHSSQAFQEKILAHADIMSNSGKGIALFPKVPILTPRGRYDVELFPTFVKLHGKTFDFKILHSSISRLFLLPKPDSQHYFVVVFCFLQLFIFEKISVDPPVRQGQTKHPHIVFQFPKEETITVTLNLDK
jgi:structure-specific recognition protein 1